MGFETMRLADGRTLEYCVSGRREAKDLLIFHMVTPMAAVDFPPAIEAAAAAGIRTATYSRPGYAGSTPKPGRTMADAADDTAALADHLGADSFFLVGWSGGGAPALAGAALIPERVRACMILAGSFPPDEVDGGLDSLEWYPAEGRDWHRRLLSSDLDDLIPEFEQSAEAMARVTAEFEGDGSPAVDVDALHRFPAGAEAVALSLRRSVSKGIWGMVGDELSWARPWGFRVADIGVPVTIRHGTADRNVPIGEGRWLVEHIPGARAQILEGEGHASIVMPFEPVIETLLDTSS